MRSLRAPSWTDGASLDAFLQTVGALPPEDLLKLLPMLTDRSLAAEGPAHRARALAFVALCEQAPHGDLFVPVVRALRSADPALRAQLAALLPKVNNPAGHPELCELLGVEDGDLRKLGAHVLKQVGGRTAIEILSGYMRDPGFAGRMETLDIIGPKAGHHGLAVLEGSLGLGRFPEKMLALRYLGDAKLMAKDLPGAARVLAVAVGDGDDRVRAQAATALAQVTTEDHYLETMGELLDSPNPILVKAIVEAVRRFPSRRMVGVLTRRLRMGPHGIRMMVLESLEAMGIEEVLAPVVDALSHTNLQIRTRAAQVLSNLGASGKVDVAQVVLWLLRAPDPNLRRTAVEVARRVSDKGEIIPRLLRLLRDEDWWVREQVMDALAEMSNTAITRHVVEYLGDPSDVVRRYAVRALQRLNDPRALGALVRTAMNDGDWWVRETAIEAIGLLKDERAVPYLVDILGKQEDMQIACILALRTIGAKTAAQQVSRLVSSPSADVRLAVIQTLAEADEPAHVMAAQECEQDPDGRVRQAVKELLARWNIAEAASLSADKAAQLLDKMLVAMVKSEGDDLLIAANRCPYIKRMGRITPLSQTVFSAEQLRAILMPHLSAPQREALDALKDIDFSYEIRGLKLRFRGHIFQQTTGLSAVFRTIRSEIPQLERLGLPPLIRTFAEMKNGLVLVGGPTGSGKSTTLAALVDHINRTSDRHIVTIEDPIETVHSSRQSLVNQREVGAHTRSFEAALRSTLRQDPDVILVGEMRDLTTISFAVTAAETGHLVFGTVHTVSADTSIDRLINTFPPPQQPQVRAMLAESLRAVVCQHLLRRKDGQGRALAVEVMLNNDAVSNLIRKSKTFQIPSVIATSRDAGMQSMDSELVRLVKEGKVSAEEGYMKAFDKKAFESAIAPPPPKSEAARPASRPQNPGKP
jgi:twitching motility protein PilT